MINQMTTKFTVESEDGFIVAALGDTFAHLSATRLCLLLDEMGQRQARVLKSSCCPDRTVPFRVTVSFTLTVSFQGIHNVFEFMHLL